MEITPSFIGHPLKVSKSPEILTCNSENIWAPISENKSSEFLTKYDSNQSAQLKKLAGILKFSMEQA